MPIPYCTPEDVILKLDDDPTKVQSNRLESFRNRAESASQQWDTDTGNPMRTVRVGAPERKPTWETHQAREASRTPPIRIGLDNRNINPIDPDEGDTIEVRTGRNDYRDITDEEGDEWVLDERRGAIRIFRYIIQRAYWENPTDRFLRITYRHGGLGGDPSEGYGTTLDGSVENGDTTFSVADASGFPTTEFSALVGTADSLEAVRVTDITGDELTVDRGIRYTDDVDHADGATINYAPADVREAVAAKAAEMLVISDEEGLSVPDNGALSSRRERADRFKQEYERAASKQSNVRTL